MVNEKNWEKLASLLELQTEMFSNLLPNSDALDEFESRRMELMEEISEIRDREPIDRVSSALVGKIINRTKRGRITYGATMERNDLGPFEWGVHLHEELIDGALYLERLLQDMQALLDRRGKPKLSKLEVRHAFEKALCK